MGIMKKYSLSNGITKAIDINKLGLFDSMKYMS